MIRNCSRSVVVDVPVERAYEIWSDFARFPLFLRHVDEVRVEGQRLFWNAGGARWEAVLTEMTPNQRVSWRRLDGPSTHAVVSFAPSGGGRVEVTLGAEYDVKPGQRDDKANLYERILESFKAYAEQGGPAVLGMEWAGGTAEGPTGPFG